MNAPMRYNYFLEDDILWVCCGVRAPCEGHIAHKAPATYSELVAPYVEAEEAWHQAPRCEGLFFTQKGLTADRCRCSM